MAVEFKVTANVGAWPPPGLKLREILDVSIRSPLEREVAARELPIADA